MTTLLIPETVDATGHVDVWAQLTAFLALAKPGDIIQNPHPNAIYACDFALAIDRVGVKYFWEGAAFHQRTTRPYGGPPRTGCTITNTDAGTHLACPTRIPSVCNWGYVSGGPIPANTEIVIEKDGMGGILNHHAPDATGVTIQFTSKADRGRSGFNITGTDLEVHDATWVGPNLQSLYEPELEAQHGVNCASATGVLLENVNAHHMWGDGIYLTRLLGGTPTTHLTAVGGTLDSNGRSGIVPINCTDIAISGYSIDHVNRTTVDIEPPDATCVLDRFSLTRSCLGRHQLFMVSSAGNADAYVGAVDISHNVTMKNAPDMYLVGGDQAHLRGPYTVNGNASDGASFGTPSGALIQIQNAVSAVVQDNRGIVLQTGRSPEMAVVRSRASGPVVVSGNVQTGGIEAGPVVA